MSIFHWLLIHSLHHFFLSTPLVDGRGVVPVLILVELVVLFVLVARGGALCAFGRENWVLGVLREFGIGDLVPGYCFNGDVVSLAFNLLVVGLPVEFLCNVE